MTASMNPDRLRLHLLRGNFDDLLVLLDACQRKAKLLGVSVDGVLPLTPKSNDPSNPNPIMRNALECWVESIHIPSENDPRYKKKLESLELFKSCLATLMAKLNPATPKSESAKVPEGVNTIG